MKKTRRRYTQLTVKEVSGVDVPAQEGAKVAITKRAPMAVIVDVSKKCTLTSAESGHAHLVYNLELEAGQTDGAYLTVGEYGGQGYHSHPWLQNADGTYTIAMALGHTHEMLTAANISDAESDVDDADPATAALKRASAADPKKPPAAAPAVVVPVTTTTTEKKQEPIMMTPEEQAAFDRAMALATMTDAQKRHHARLLEGEQVAFRKMSPEERQAAVDADKVVFVAKFGHLKGREFRASDERLNSDMVAMARGLDEQAEKAITAEKAAKRVTLEKRATIELAHFGGTLDERVELLEVIDIGVAALGVTAEKAKRFGEIVAGASAAAAITQKAAGSRAGVEPGEGTPLAKFQTKLVEFAKAANQTAVQATAAFIETAEGHALYLEAYPLQLVVAG